VPSRATWQQRFGGTDRSLRDAHECSPGPQLRACAAEPSKNGADMFRFFRKQSPLNRPCSGCGGPSRFGYGEHPETKLADLRPLCLACLKADLGVDYGKFVNRAVVVEPIEGPPVYVFQTLAAWKAAFGESPMPGDVEALLGQMGTECRNCGSEARFLWIDSEGLTAETLSKVLEQGLDATLLQNGRKLVELCAPCCVEHIVQALTLRRLSYIEVCSPTGAEPGIVLPMAY
jgi:hypothetical protein